MKGIDIRVSLLLGLVGIEWVGAQSLPSCAQVCVATTKTKCKSTDYACACSDGKYLPRLIDCIQDACDDQSRTQAHGYLASLCLAVGYPLEIVAAPAGAVRELRHLAKIQAPASIIERQLNDSFPETGFDSFTTFETPTANATAAASGTVPANNPARTTNPSDSNNNDGGGGLSTGAKIGIGVGVPLGVGLIAGLVALAFFLGRRSKRQQAAAAAAPGAPGQGMMQQPQMAGPTGPVELDPRAQYIGQELPTKGNTPEMPAGSPPSGYGKPIYAWPQQGQPQPGQQYPQYVQPGQYPAQVQQQYPPPGQQWPQQGQPQAAELPERR